MCSLTYGLTLFQTGQLDSSNKLQGELKAEPPKVKILKLHCQKSSAFEGDGFLAHELKPFRNARQSEPLLVEFLQDLQKTTPAGKSEVKTDTPATTEVKTEVAKVDVVKPDPSKKGEAEASKPTVTAAPVKPVVRW